jgi:hypothetical protein
VDYGLYQAFSSAIPQILRPKNIKLEGVPEIKDNADDYRLQAGEYLKKAEEAVGAYNVSSFQR